MTGAEFNTEVLAFLDTDAQRRGISNFREAFKRAAIADLAAYIDEFAVGKLTFADNEETPFDTDSAEAVAEFLKSKIARNVDRDLQLSQAHWTDYLILRRRLYVRLKEARTPELRPWIGKPYTIILNLRKGMLPQPIIGNVWFTVKTYKGDPDECAIIVLERDAGITVLDAAKSRIRVTLEASHTSRFMYGVEYYWDVQVEDTPLAIPLYGVLKPQQPVGVGKAPKITSQPVGGTIVVGQVLSVSVVASGKTPLSYQWRKNGVAIAGATNATYSYTTTATTDSGNYDVVVSNSFGTVTSNVAVWVVGVAPVPTAPTIVTHPVGATLTVGQTINLSVSASGTAPLTYQWRKGGVNISGATSSSYAHTTTATTDSGSYTVVVTNPYGSVTSNAAVVTVNAVVVVTGALLREDGTPLLREDGTAYQREVAVVI
jgi:hypothetical protein